MSKRFTIILYYIMDQSYVIKKMKTDQLGRRLSNFYLFAVLNGVPLLFASSLANLAPSISDGCNASFVSTCIFRRIIYCASWINGLVFIILSLLSYLKFIDGFSRSSSQNWWLLALPLSWGSLLLALYFYNAAVWNTLCEMIYIGGAFFLCCQSATVLEFVHQMHRYVVTTTSKSLQEQQLQLSANTGLSSGATRSSFPYLYLLHLISSLCFIGAAVVCAIVLLPALNSVCSFRWFLDIGAIWSGVVFCVLSLTTAVNKGLLIPAVVWLHSSLLCWYLKLSMSDETCNTAANVIFNSEKVAALIVFSLLFLFTLYFGIIGMQINIIFQQFGEAFGIPTSIGSGVTGGYWIDEELGMSHSFCGIIPYSGGSYGNGLSNCGDSSGGSTCDGKGYQNVADMPPIGETSSLLGNKSVSVTELSSGSDYAARRFLTDKNNGFLLFASASLYFPILCSNWGNDDGSPEAYSSYFSLAVCCKLAVVILSFTGYATSMYSSSRVYSDMTKTYHHK